MLIPMIFGKVYALAEDHSRMILKIFVERSSCGIRHSERSHNCLEKYHEQSHNCGFQKISENVGNFSRGVCVYV